MNQRNAIALALGALVLAIYFAVRRPVAPPPESNTAKVVTPSVPAAAKGGDSVPAPRVSEEKMSMLKGEMRKMVPSDFGRLPRLPEGYKGADTFTPLVGRDGTRPRGNVRVASHIDIGKGTCPLAAGTVVTLLGQRGDLFLVDVWPPCETATTRIRQGYVPAEEVVLAPKLAR